MTEGDIVTQNWKLILLTLLRKHADSVINLTKRVAQLTAGQYPLPAARIYTALDFLQTNDLVTLQSVSSSGSLTAHLRPAGEQFVQTHHSEWTTLKAALTQEKMRREQLLKSAVDAAVAAELAPFGTDPKSAQLQVTLVHELMPFAIREALAGGEVSAAAHAATLTFGDLNALAVHVLDRQPVRAMTHNADSAVTAHTALVETEADSELTATPAQSNLHHSLVGIRNIDIVSQNADVRVLPIVSSELTVHEAFTDFKSAYAGKLVQEGDEIHILPGQRTVNGELLSGRFHDAVVTVGIPMGFRGQVTIHNTRGNVGVLNLRQLDTLNVIADVGNVELVYLGVRYLDATSTRGDITLRGSNVTAATITADSGSPLVAQSVFTQLAVHCDTGEVKLRKLNVVDTIRLTAGHVNVLVTDVRARTITAQCAAGYLAGVAVSAETVDLAVMQGDVHYQIPTNLQATLRFTAGKKLQLPPELSELHHGNSRHVEGVLGTTPSQKMTLSAPAGDVIVELSPA